MQALTAGTEESQRANPEEISLDDDEDGGGGGGGGGTSMEEDEGRNVEVTTKSVPAAVFERAGLGGGEGEEGEKEMGALERLRAAKK